MRQVWHRLRDVEILRIVDGRLRAYGALLLEVLLHVRGLVLNVETGLDARGEHARAIAPGWDIYALEAEWRAYWVASGRARLRSADRAYLGYVRARMGQGAEQGSA